MLTISLPAQSTSKVALEETFKIKRIKASLIPKAFSALNKILQGWEALTQDRVLGLLYNWALIEIWAEGKMQAGFPGHHSNPEVVQGAKHNSQQRRFFSASSFRHLRDVAPGWWGVLCLLTNAGRGFASSYWNNFWKESIAYNARCQQEEKRLSGIDVCVTKEAKKAAMCLLEPA